MLVLLLVYCVLPSKVGGRECKDGMGWDGALLLLDDNVCLTDWTLIVSEEESLP